MFRWLPLAFVRITVFFTGGILLALAFPAVISINIITATLALVVTVYIIIVVRNRKSERKYDVGWIGLMALMIVAYGYTLLRTETSESDHIIHLTDKPTAYEVRVTGYPRLRPSVYLMDAEILKVRINSHWREVSGKIRISVARNDSSKKFDYGDRLLIKGSPSEVKEPSNPHEFDFKKYLSYKNIYHQHYIESRDVLILSRDTAPGLLSFAYGLRLHFQHVLGKYIHGEQERAIALALIIGVTDDVDNELVSAFSATGAMHVLAVSGLHVGILYAVVLALLSPLKRWKKGRVIISVISLIVLWLYAMATGLSPSVLRAVTMFSMLAIGRAFDRRTNVYNTLAASAFILLCVDPFLIMSVGFQLSYLAVTGIVYLHPRIFQWVQPSSTMSRKVWEITSVSMSAQLATFPLGLFYFHQFPIYFLFANLLVVPVALFILVAGLALVGLSFIGPLAEGLGWMLEKVIFVMNKGIFFLEDLPGSVVTGISITSYQCVLLFLIVLSMLALFRLRRFSYLIIAMTLLTIFSALNWFHYMEIQTDTDITVYDTPRYAAIDVIHKGKIYTVADSALFKHPEKIARHLLPNRIAHGTPDAGNSSHIRNAKGCWLAYFNEQTLLGIREKEYSFPKVQTIDIVIVSNNAVADVEQLRKQTNFKILILDSSNSYAYGERLLREAGNPENIYSVRHSGAFSRSI